MLYIQNLLQNIAATHENIRAKVPNKARFGIIALLVVLSFIILIFKAEWLMAHMVALLPVFYFSAVLVAGFKRALYGTAIFIFVCFALWIRVGPPHEGVLGGSYVLFAENDGWYNARLIENLVNHFPFRNSFDPYTLYPYGQQIPFAPFFDWSIALLIWVAGLGHPSTGLIEKMAAYFPTILGALTIIPVYFIGKEIFNRNAGLLAAGLLAILPGEFLFRSIMGFTDHHAAEMLFSTITILFFIMAIKRAQENRLTLSQIKRREWSILRKPILFALLAGIMLGVYLLSWIGGALFILIIFIYLVLQYVLDHLKGRSTDYLFITGIPLFMAALLITGPFSKFLLYSANVYASLVIGILTICGLSILSWFMNKRKIKQVFYPAVILIFGIAGAGILYLIDPYLFHSIIDRFGTFRPNYQGMTIMEAQPLFMGFNISQLIDHRVWSYFTTGLFIVPISLFTIVYSSIRREKIGKCLFLGLIGVVLLTVIIDQIASVPFWLYLMEGIISIIIYTFFEKSSSRIILLVWSTVTLLILLGQTRFAYYVAINVALLSSYILLKIPQGITQIFTWLHWKDSASEDTGKTRAEKRRAKVKQEQPAFSYLRPKYLASVLSIVIIFFLTIYPNMIYGTYNHSGWSPKNSATLFLPYHPYGPNGDWHEALTWMKDNTPDPFGDPDFYYELYDAPKSGETYDYPDSAYGVMSWWDYGHWITRIARRIPNANPFQSGIGGTTGTEPNPSDNPGASTFMTAQNEATASGIMDVLDSKYVAIDFETAYGKFHTMITWSGGNVSDYYEFLYLGENGELRTYNNPGSRAAELQVFYLPYYQSICARLYNFGTAAAVPNNSTFVVLFSEETDENGEKYKVIADVANDGNPFPNYNEARSFLDSHPGYIVVGLDPFSSPIPQEALKEYELIHTSPSIVTQRGDRSLYYVEIFEYTGYE